jgi:hypothetical protein
MAWIEYSGPGMGSVAARQIVVEITNAATTDAKYRRIILAVIFLLRIGLSASIPYLCGGYLNQEGLTNLFPRPDFNAINRRRMEAESNGVLL